MIQSFADLWKVLLGTAIIFIVLLFFFRKHILHIFDPLLFYLVAQAFSIELGFLIIEDTTYLINFLFCEACFFCGFLYAAGKPLRRADFKPAKLFKQPDQTKISILKWYAIFGFIILIIANLILIKINGIVLLSDDPNASKVDSYAGGLGVFRRLNWGILYLVGLALAIMFIYKKQFRYLILFALLLLIPVTGGSKGSLLYFIFLISLFSCFGDVKFGKSFKILRTGSFFILLLAIFLASVLVSGGSEGDTIQDKIFKLGTRFLFFGDSIIYYFNHSSIEYFSHNNFINYIQDQTNSILGLLKITSYKPLLGFQLINYYFDTNSSTFGPNIPYYIAGNIYFGFFGSFIYSFIIGTAIGFVRRLFYNLVRNGSVSILYILIILHLNIVITTLAQDSQLFITQQFDTFLFSVPVVVLVVCIHLYYKRIQNNSFYKMHRINV